MKLFNLHEIDECWKQILQFETRKNYRWVFDKLSLMEWKMTTAMPIELKVMNILMEIELFASRLSMMEFFSPAILEL